MLASLLFQEYFVWHQNELRQTNVTNWSSHRFLVMQCIKGMDDHCGGTADRLKPLLFLLREAYVTNRILLIYWTMPTKLEEFLVPPRGGLDWRTPTWFQPIVSGIGYYIILYYICLFVGSCGFQSNACLINRLTRA
jgi:hypothetical protein